MKMVYDVVKKLKIILAFSAGGHFTEMMQIEDTFTKHNVVYVTTKREDTKELDAYFVDDIGRTFLGVVRNLVQSWQILMKEKPDVIVTTGAGLVVPICYLGKLFGARIVFIESFCRIRKPSLTGRFLYPITDLFLVQWKELLHSYGHKARYGGRVF